MNKFNITRNNSLGFVSWTVCDDMNDYATFDKYSEAVEFLTFMNE